MIPVTCRKGTVAAMQVADFVLARLTDRAFKTALTRRGVSTIIIPDDIQEEDAQPSPPKMHGAVFSSVGWSRLGCCRTRPSWPRRRRS
jgi:thiamine pyrophosphate-dependent acetolactate synthase large subunit-like protein